ncbi:hypothetical protein PC128_g10729 [Phytophthora cactorum]|nr:hypothetical protein PC120_g19763 [Phytophthora cactorum]KAG3048396.1 hypothetical protein PC121_g19513 [Phytophthora cactorum]KAG3192001.1 hypothetical protein PC128_g10729 [Phytophthora cactorum]KAG4044321.1 hypothetical protein PC123_g20230 [Phytophthora cactorum]
MVTGDEFFHARQVILKLNGLGCHSSGLCAVLEDALSNGDINLITFLPNGDDVYRLSMTVKLQVLWQIRMVEYHIAFHPIWFDPTEIVESKVCDLSREVHELRTAHNSEIKELGDIVKQLRQEIDDCKAELCEAKADESDLCRVDNSTEVLQLQATTAEEQYISWNGYSDSGILVKYP